MGMENGMTQIGKLVFEKEKKERREKLEGEGDFFRPTIITLLPRMCVTVV